MSMKIKAVIDNLSDSPTTDEYEIAIVMIRGYNNEVLELMSQWAEFLPLMAEKGGSS